MGAMNMLKAMGGALIDLFIIAFGDRKAFLDRVAAERTKAQLERWGVPHL